MRILKVIMGKNGAYSEVHYYKQGTLKRSYPGASHSDVIRLKIVRPGLQKEPLVDLFMTPGETIDIMAGLTSALQEAITDEVPMFHKDYGITKGGTMSPVRAAVAPDRFQHLHKTNVERSHLGTDSRANTKLSRELAHPTDPTNTKEKETM